MVGTRKDILLARGEMEKVSNVTLGKVDGNTIETAERMCEKRTADL